MSLLLALQGSPPVETTSVDKWYIALSLPTRRKLFLPYQGTDSFVSLVTGGEIVTLDKWFSGLSLPSRTKLRQNATSQQNYFIPSEIVTLDKWFAQFPVPVLRRRNNTSPQFFSFDPRPTVPFTWNEPYAELFSARVKGRWLFDFGNVPAFFQPPSVISLDWFNGFSVPTKGPNWISGRGQQALAFNELPIVSFSWASAYSEPQRIKASIAWLYDLGTWAPFTPIPAPPVTDVSWIAGFSVPSILTLKIGTQYIDFGNVGPLFPPVIPPVSTGDFTVSGSEVIDRFPTLGVNYTYAAITKRTN